MWQTGRFRVDLSTPRVMGIVNVTPDSFSDGAPGITTEGAILRCERLVRDGADILDLGGESTRPGAEPVPAGVEWARIEPVLRAALQLGVPVSVDTMKAEVMQASLDLGADAVNDVRALAGEGALDVVSRHGFCGVCLMHIRGTPRTMQGLADYADVVTDVRDALAARVAECVAAGIDRSRIVVDPGIGFAKSPVHNLALLERQRELLGDDGPGVPLLVGWSRKSTLAKIAGVSARPPEARTDAERETLDAASAVAAVLAVERGARIVRVHDVARTVAALAIWKAARGGPG